MEHSFFLFHVPYSMSLNDFIEKLRAKPENERRRIAAVATAVAFSIIFLIWLVSFSEMNRSAEDESNSTSVSDQLEEMKGEMGTDKQSIEEMMQGLPEEGSGVEAETVDQESGEAQSEEATEGQSQDANQDIINNNQKNQPEIPQLP
ncbi:MAG: hypothetical protein QMD77_01160 [Patescibacteria group bacterium]|nr:hypothetical protein [Patescibacteria group bacterium]